MAKYNNIPVKPEVYLKLRLIAEANNRGLGDQVSEWVERELPECDHPKVPVVVQVYPGTDVKPTNNGWYCQICNRVYQYSAVEMPVVKIKRQAKKEAQVTSSAGYDKL